MVILSLFVIKLITDAKVAPDFAIQLLSAMLLISYLALAEWPLRSFAKRLAEVMTAWTVISLLPMLALGIILPPSLPACLPKAT